MSISFTPSQTILLAKAINLSFSGYTDSPCLQSASLVCRSFERFEKEFCYYQGSLNKRGLLAVVREYRRLLLDALDDFKSTLQDDHL